MKNNTRIYAAQQDISRRLYAVNPEDRRGWGHHWLQWGGKPQIIDTIVEKPHNFNILGMLI